MIITKKDNEPSESSPEISHDATPKPYTPSLTSAISRGSRLPNQFKSEVDDLTIDWRNHQLFRQLFLRMGIDIHVRVYRLKRRSEHSKYHQTRQSVSTRRQTPQPCTIGAGAHIFLGWLNLGVFAPGIEDAGKDATTIDLNSHFEEADFTLILLPGADHLKGDRLILLSRSEAGPRLLPSFRGSLYASVV